MNLHENEWKRKVWRKEEVSYDPKLHIMRQNDGGCYGSGMGSLLFILGVTVDRRSGMNSEVYKALISAKCWEN